LKRRISLLPRTCCNGCELKDSGRSGRLGILAKHIERRAVKHLSLLVPSPLGQCFGRREIRYA
jgi:hypothetical protein